MSSSTTIYTASYGSAVKSMKRISASIFLISCIAVPGTIAYKIFPKDSEKSNGIDGKDEESLASDDNGKIRICVAGSVVLLITYAFTMMFHAFAKRYVLSIDLLNWPPAIQSGKAAIFPQSFSPAPDTTISLSTLGFFGQSVHQKIKLSQIHLLPPSASTTATFIVPELKNRPYFVSPAQGDLDENTITDKEILLTRMFIYLKSKAKLI